MLKTKIEALMFSATKAMTARALANFINRAGEAVKTEEVAQAISELKNEYNSRPRGVRIVQAGEEYQMVTAPESADLVKKFLKEDITGELTPASLEALTVIAYRGPISKLELEQIRGVNCSLILRNLLIRGLIQANEKKAQNFYEITTDFLKYLGINSADELPDYQRLHNSENLDQYLARLDEKN